MSKFKNSVKDLVDLRKPVKTIKGKLSLIGLALILELIYYTLAGLIRGFGVSKPIIDSFFFIAVILASIYESIIFWGLLYMLLRLLAWLQFLKINLLWIFIIVIGLFFGYKHLGTPGNTFAIAIFVKSFSGILYGWLVVKTQNLWSIIIAHMLWNAAVIIFFV